MVTVAAVWRGDEVLLVASEQLWCWGQGRAGLGTQLAGRGAPAAGLLDTNCQIIRRVAVTPAQRGSVAGRCSRHHVLLPPAAPAH